MLDLLLNLAAAGLTLGSMYALLAVSFALIYNVTHVFHLAHGATFALGAYLVYWFSAAVGLPLLVALVVSLGVTSAVGVAMEVGLYRPLRRAGATHMILFLASVGMLIVVEGLLGLGFGTATLSFATLPFEAVAFGPVTVTSPNVAMLLSWPLIVLVIVYLLRAREGRLLRAVGDDQRVATSLGIPVDRMFSLSFALGSGLVVPAAVLYGWSQGLVPVMGLNAILIASAAVIIGGRYGLLPGAIVALVLGTVQSLLVAFVPTGWQDAMIFALLLAALLVRPQGIFGFALRW
ncbi:MAG: branched-chain amino acid ABC transporter permease [Chloroflexi bacterium]|nr:branched-chain amino acid ABC transporter permease [Chloroflexota bacterium]